MAETLLRDVVLRVIDAGANYHIVAWNIDKLKNLSIKGYNLYYFESTTDTGIKCNTDLIDDLYLAWHLPNYTKFTRGYYQLGIVTHDDKEYKTPLYSIFDLASKYEENIVRRTLWTMCQSVTPTSTPMAAFQKRRNGKLCPKCTVNRQMGNILANCHICLGTGFVSGYYKPVVFFCEYLSPVAQRVMDRAGTKAEEAHLQIRTASVFSVLRYGDYLRELTPPFRLWAIMGITHHELNTNPLISIYDLQQEESSHPLTSLELPTIDRWTRKFSYINIWKEYIDVINKFNNEVSKLPWRRFFEEAEN